MAAPINKPPPENHDGRVFGWLTAVKGLTITNAIVIVMLVLVAIPSYVVYRALDDEKVMDKIMSSYDQLRTDTSCLVSRFNLRGGAETWAIANGFAYEGRDRWVVSVILDHRPNIDEMRSYCETLKVFVDFLRNPAAGEPGNNNTPSIPPTDPPNDQPFGGPR